MPTLFEPKKSNNQSTSTTEIWNNIGMGVVIGANERKPMSSMRIKKPKGVSNESWKKAVEVYEIAARNGDKFPELTVAQGAIESGWFNKASGSNNYFGQKAGKGESSIMLPTREVVGGKDITIKQAFKNYGSLDEAIKNRVTKWGTKYQQAENVEDALYSIWNYNSETGSGQGYATVPNYDVGVATILAMMGVNFNVKNRDNNTSNTSGTTTAGTERGLPEGYESKVGVTNFGREDEHNFLRNLVSDGEQQMKEDNENTEVSEAQRNLENKTTELNNKKEFIAQIVEKNKLDYEFTNYGEPKSSGNYREGGVVYDDEYAKNNPFNRVFRRDSILEKQVMDENKALYNIGKLKDFKVLEATGKSKEYLESTGGDIEFFPKGDTWFPYLGDESQPIKVPNKNKYRVLVNDDNLNVNQLKEAVGLDFVSHAMHADKKYKEFHSELSNKLLTKYDQKFIDRNGGVDAYVRGILSDDAEYSPYKEETSFIEPEFINSLKDYIKTGINKKY